MAIEVGDIVAHLQADTSQFTDPIEKAFAEAKKSINKLKGDIDGNLGNVGGPLDGLEKKVGGIKDILSGAAISGIGLGLTNYITGPLIEMGKAAVETADQFTRARMAFTTMLGSQAAADKFLKTLQDIAVTTPFEFTQLQDASKRLLAMGIAAEKIPDMIIKIGDAVAGLGSGAVGFNRITLAIGQMNAKGRATAEEMKQFTEAGIGAWDALAKHLGITVAEAMDRVTKKQVDSATAITAIMAGMGQKFNGLMAQQSNTIEGTLSNLRDTATLMLGEIGAELVKTLKIPEALKALGEFARAFLDWFKQLDSGTKTFVLTFAGALAASGPILVAIGGFMAALAAGMGPIMAGGAIIAGVIAGVTTIVMNWQAIKDKGLAIWTGIKDGITNIVMGTYNGIKAWLVDKLNAIIQPIQGFADSVLGIFKKLRYEIVGGSEVPDMITEIGQEMTRLDSVMVGPVRIAAQAVRKNFADLRADAQATSRDIFAATMAADERRMKDAYAGSSVRVFNSEAKLKAQADMQADIARGLEAEKMLRGQINSELDDYFKKENAIYRDAEAKNQEYQGRFIVQQAIAREQMRFGWSDVFGSMSQSAQHAFGQIRNSFGQAIVGLTQGTTNWAQFWQATQGAMLNSAIQWGLDVIGTFIAKNAMILATESVTAAGVMSIWTATTAAVTGAFGAMAGAIALFFTGTIIPMFVSVGTAVATFLSAIASSLTLSIFGAPFSVPVWAAVGLVLAAIGAISAFAFGAFAEGGVITKPTMALMGEAGPEAVIPLSKLGQFGGGRQTTVVIELDGRTIARSVYDNMPSVMRIRGVSA